MSNYVRNAYVILANSLMTLSGHCKLIHIGSFASYPTGPMRLSESITDALGQINSYQYDLAGRLTQQTAPDGRQINYSYDANGNVTRLTPPNRPAHCFSYDGLDQTTAYQPPLLAGISNPNTSYSYNKDKQIILITRPDGQSITPNYNASSGKLDSLSTPQGNTT